MDAQEDESIIKRRKADEQDRPVDILSIPNLRPAEDDPDGSYEEFVTAEPDKDVSETFHPAQELDDYYEGEPEAPPQFAPVLQQQQAAVVHVAEDGGNVSEELMAWEDEKPVSRKRKAKR
jgi:COMPASS component SWD1